MWNKLGLHLPDAFKFNSLFKVGLMRLGFGVAKHSDNITFISSIARNKLNFTHEDRTSRALSGMLWDRYVE